ncbi:MAG: bifunctional 3-hydroxydecanoyl-ACP dehydratase/trans-2-decenoyl-ACP isomerase [Acidihalobacter sp.]|uniref:bifunctional 3-hydroxydecanoyl-ACP dehydratase/trans-2-decenoyl-ACP isomerase n=1 Tax=Acidihalobacter sp. TaxID=1872108 RepID=UPI00307EE01D
MRFTHEQVLAISTGEVFGPGNAKLPAAPLLMVDEIGSIEISGGRYGRGYLEAALQIRPEQWFFSCHFAGDPVMPGCLGLDALWQLLGVFLACSGLHGRGRALGVEKVKFGGQVYPDAGEIAYRLDIKRVFAKPMSVGVADGVVLHAGQVIYQADGLKVGLIR